MYEYSISPFIGFAFLLISLSSVFFLYRKIRKAKHDSLDGFLEKPPLDFSQEAVMRDYQRTALLQKNRAAQGALHLFFSPSRVPVGLTDDQIAICVWLYQFRQVQNDEQIRKALEVTENGTNKDVPFEQLLWPRALPSEFSPKESMTQEHFEAGLYKLLAQLAKDKVC
ncbi:MAG: hypothetical protein WC250_02175 [Candidatus Paceibacterota bacterium]|jgi:hypothetical protein